MTDKLINSIKISLLYESFLRRHLHYVERSASVNIAAMDLYTALVWMLPTSLLLWITYRYMTAKPTHWEKQGIVSVPAWQVFTGVIKLLFEPMPEQQLKSYLRYGKLYGQQNFGSLFLSVAEPDFIREILVKDFQHFVDRLDVRTGDHILDNMLSALKGEKWKRMRTVMSPTFSSGKIKKMTGTILECADTLKKNLGKYAESKEPVDVKILLGTFTMDAIASTAFSTKVDSHNNPNNPFVVAASKFFTNVGWKFVIILMFNKLVKYLPFKLNVMSSPFFEKITSQLISKRRNKPEEKRNDFLQLMLNASEVTQQDESSFTKENHVEGRNGEVSSKTHEADAEDEDKLKDKLKEYKGLTDTEITSQCVVFFIGGFEGVSSTVSFALYELALNEKYQEKLIAEIDEVLRKNKNELKYEDVQEMKYLDCVVSEALRKYPIAIFLQRMATIDCTIGEKKIKIPKGTIVTIPVYAMHHDPEYFPDSEKFDPDRFSPEERAARNPYVYLPFGAGPRNCIAMRFALTEVKLCLAHLLRHFRFHRCSATPVTLKFDVGQPQILANNIMLSIEKRKDAVISTSD